jgi:hypothetical protein
MHTYNDLPCPSCGDPDGCHIPGKVKRTKMTARYGQDYPRMVCLCGSTRFGDAYAQAMRAETLAGNIVLTVGLLGHAEGIDMNGPLKAVLDELHKRKIDASEEVLVLNVGGYIGSSTRSEIEYAEKLGKQIRYLEPKE